MTTIEKGTTLDVVLNRVEDDWRTTAYIDGKLYDSGFRWTTDTTRDHLHTLSGLGLVQRQKAGAGYRWRLTPVTEVPLGQVPVSAVGMTPLSVTAAELAEMSKHVAELIAKRLVRRAAYDMGRMVLSSLDGWIEGVRDNHEANGHRDAFESCCGMFHPGDIRAMVNDACRVMGAPEAWRKDETDAAS